MCRPGTFSPFFYGGHIPVKKPAHYILSFFLITLLLMSCTTVLLTSRQQLNVVPDSSMLAMSFQQYDTFLELSKLSTNTIQRREVKRVGGKIQKAVERYFSNRRMSHMLALQFGGVALSTALSEKHRETRASWMGAFGLGAQFGFMLPYSRIQENEADQLGLIFMAMAGYDPHRAISFWEKMSQKKESKAQTEFMSIHPSDKTRITNINLLMPTAMKYYRE